MYTLPFKLHKIKEGIPRDTASLIEGYVISFKLINNNDLYSTYTHIPPNYHFKVYYQSANSIQDFNNYILSVSVFPKAKKYPIEVKFNDLLGFDIGDIPFKIISKCDFLTLNDHYEGTKYILKIQNVDDLSEFLGFCFDYLYKGD